MELGLGRVSKGVELDGELACIQQIGVELTESCLIFISRPAVVMAVSLPICVTARIADTWRGLGLESGSGSGSGLG